MLKDLYKKKSVIRPKSPSKVKETDEDEEDEETKKRVMKMVANEEKMKNGLKMRLINTMMQHIH